MDKATASQILSAAVSLDKAIGELDAAVSDVRDEKERREFANKLGEFLRLVNDHFIRPILRQYPDLDPDK